MKIEKGATFAKKIAPTKNLSRVLSIESLDAELLPLSLSAAYNLFSEYFEASLATVFFMDEELAPGLLFF